jgi:TetR/AcrR family transcriptional regulator, transcriptional repressor for nem operon
MAGLVGFWKHMGKAEKTRQYIVEMTAPIFNVKGYEGTSLNDMIDATGLTKGSIYGNFENKDAVALAAFDHNFDRVRQIIGREMDKHNTIKAKLLVYASVYDDFLRSPFPEGGCPILNTAIEADDTHAALKEKATTALLSWKKSIISLIETGIAKKEFRSKVDAEQIALTMIAMIEGGIMIAKLTGKSEHRKAVMRSMKKLILDLG